ncbi:hypothetical protein Raf01_08460 [Rugosimonospora africana]|uniref:Uncharacterized protein n=1 Tax=Rugosimonospora africana TaxID=556532 RepID=A0A8J3QKK6_9ACTN|nr:hypothetical protein Raf01_08460 [Rugosimonospora africana]
MALTERSRSRGVAEASTVHVALVLTAERAAPEAGTALRVAAYFCWNIFCTVSGASTTEDESGLLMPAGFP